MTVPPHLNTTTWPLPHAENAPVPHCQACRPLDGHRALPEPLRGQARDAFDTAWPAGVVPAGLGRALFPLPPVLNAVVDR